MPGTGELLIILLIVMVVFGASRLPMIGEGMGRAIRNFKKGISGDEEEKGRKQLSRGEDADRVIEKDEKAQTEVVDKK